MSTHGTYLSQSQQQRQIQTLAPQLRQSLEFLQVPMLELRTLIQRELEQNPTLEELPDDHTPLEVEASEGSVTDHEGDLEFKEQYEKLAQLDDEWRDYFVQAGSGRQRNSDDEARRQYLLDSLTQEETLQEHLVRQLGLVEMPEDDRQTALMLIGNINDDGYLNVTLGELAETTSLDVPRMERILALIQEMDPVGVGARDLQECLRLQLDRLGLAGGLEERIVREHLGDLGAHRHAEVAARLGVGVAEVHRAARLIATLEPKPGRAYVSEGTTYVVPEVAVTRTGDDFAVTLNNERLPRVRISKQYRQLMEDPATPKETKDYIRDKIRAGLFMLRSIDQRQSTIQRIAQEIVRIQRGFFEHGVSHLRPLVMADIARIMGIHETTVSRAIAGKYMQTPQGLFEMKYFFTPGFTAADGQTVSNKSIMDAIEQIVADEDVAHPRSDQEIVGLLAERGLKVARRTIAKYRDELKIPPSHLRRA